MSAEFQETWGRVIAQVADGHSGLWEVIGDEMRTQRIRRYTTWEPWCANGLRGTPPPSRARPRYGTRQCRSGGMHRYRCRPETAGPSRWRGTWPQTEPECQRSLSQSPEETAPRDMLWWLRQLLPEEEPEPTARLSTIIALDQQTPILKHARSADRQTSRPEPHEEYCYRCGRPETTVRRCPDCQADWYAHIYRERDMGVQRLRADAQDPSGCPPRSLLRRR